MVESGHRLNEHVGALIAELVATSDEEVQGFVKVEVHVTGQKIIMIEKSFVNSRRCKC